MTLPKTPVVLPELSAEQVALTKLYVASFGRAPEASGLAFWVDQLAQGMSFDTLLYTVFHLDSVTAIYPPTMSDHDFLVSVYANVFGKVPDAEGLQFWTDELAKGYSRASQVMRMVDVGLTTPDGTPGKAYLENRLAAADYAVQQQLAQKTEIPVQKLVDILHDVGVYSTSVSTARATVDQLTGAAVHGVAQDGYIKNGHVFADSVIANGRADLGESQATTDAAGGFTLTAINGSANGPLYVSGGTDILTGLPFRGLLSAPQASAMITPLTTLMQQYIMQGESVEQAQQHALAAAGVTNPAGQAADLTRFDPIAFALDPNAGVYVQLGVSLQAAATKLDDVMVALSQTLVAAAGGAAHLAPEVASLAVQKALADDSLHSGSPQAPLADQAFVASLLQHSVIALGLGADSPLELALTTKVNAAFANGVAAALTASAANIDAQETAYLAGGVTPAKVLSEIGQAAIVTQGAMTDQLIAAAGSSTPDMAAVAAAYTPANFDAIAAATQAVNLTPDVPASIVPVAVSLDAQPGTLQLANSYDADISSYAFTDAIGSASFARIAHFGTDDSLRFSGLGTHHLIVSSSGADVSFTVNNAGTVSQVTLVGVNPDQHAIGSLDAFNLLASGHVFIA